LLIHEQLAIAELAAEERVFVSPRLTIGNAAVVLQAALLDGGSPYRLTAA
jgi:hypothetical protein